jgi:Family of unknown function (DUF6364)
MHTKLTLRLDQHLIETAKAYAQHTGKSVSQLVADYFMQFQTLPAPTAQTNAPLTASLAGALAPQSGQAYFDKRGYEALLDAKYGKQSL